MKKYFVMLITMLSVAPAMAEQSVICKAVGSADGQGYEAVLLENSAELLINGRKVADLVLNPDAPKTDRRGADMTSLTFYYQPRANGYAMKVVSGGIMGRTLVTVSRGGFAGYSVIAQLNDCK